MRTTVLAFGACFLPALLSAQSSPFVDEKIERLLANEISGDLAFETLRITTQWHKPSGSEGFFAVARYVAGRAKEAGLADVRWIDQEAQSASWTPHRAEAWLLESDGARSRETLLGSYAEVATSIADYSRPADVTAEVVDVGAGESAADYAGKDVRGKIVLAFGNLGDVMEQAVWKRGAAGILSWSSSRLDTMDHPDQIAWSRVPEEDGPGGEKTTFAFVVSARQGKALAGRLRGEASQRWGAGAPATPEKLRVRVVVESSTLPRNKTAMVEARIPGADPSLPEIVLTAHLQEEKFSANDDQSGVASALEIGRALARLISDGKLPRPRRGIRFWWCDEIYSEYRYFADHPGEEKRVLANLNQDMVGARQSAGARTQFLARTPWWRPSYLSDVQESVLDMVVEGNNAYLSAWQAGAIPPGVGFTKPLFARIGTREPYGARAVPYFDSTDHLVFNDSWVGAPGTTLTNWPDEYIHSSGDDLWQIDPTQIKRNAFVVAATAWWLANAGDAEAAWLADFVADRAAERLARERGTALAWLRNGEGTEPERRRAASDLLSVAFDTEVAAVESTSALGGSVESRARAVARLRSVAAALTQGLSAASETPADPILSRLAARVPRRPVATLSEWMALEHEVSKRRVAESRSRREAREREQEARRSGRLRKKAAPSAGAQGEDEGAEKLSPLMEAAVMNRIDGKTNAADIARRVCAEALSAGWWYYGKTTPERIEKFLEKQAKDGLVVW